VRFAVRELAPRHSNIETYVYGEAATSTDTKYPKRAAWLKKTARWAVFSRMGSKLRLRLTDDLRSKEETLNPGFKGLLLAAKKEQVHLHLFSFATMREMGLSP